MSRLKKSLLPIGTLLLISAATYFLLRESAGNRSVVATQPEVAVKRVPVEVTGQTTGSAPAAPVAKAEVPRAVAPSNTSPMPATKADLAKSPATESSPTPRMLPAEAGLLDGLSVNGKAMEALAKHNDLDDLIDRLSDQSKREPLAAELTALHSSIAAEASLSVPSVTLKRIACGLQVCVATIFDPSDNISEWLTQFESNPATQMVSMALAPTTFTDGPLEYWLIFSTDADAKRRWEVEAMRRALDSSRR